MSVSRLPLLCAFAGGCLTTALVFGAFRADALATAAAQQQLARSSELLAAALAAHKSEQHSAALEKAAPAPAPGVLAEPRREVVAELGPELLAEAAAARETQDPASTTKAGSAVSDVLTDLEVAYRKRIVAAVPEEAPLAVERAPEPAHATPAFTQPEAPPVVAVRAVSRVAPVNLPAPTTLSEPASVAPVPIVPAPSAPPVAAAPALAAADQRPVHFGDVNNTYVTNVRQGDVYVVQQQLAMLQYLQLLGAANTGNVGRVAPAPAVRGMAPPTQQYRQFPSTLTNPDNPWGFNFAPPNLVH